MLNHRVSVLSACLISISLALTGCGKKNEKANTTQAAAQAPTPEVGVVIAQAQPIENFTELKGRANAYEVAQVRPQATGIILKRLFTEGSYVKAGQALYELDDRSNRANVENIRASVTRNQANLNALLIKESRYRQLVGTNAISKQDYDDIVASVKLAQADLNASIANLKNAEVSLGYSTIRSPISGQTSTSTVTVGALVTSGQANALVTVQRLDPIYVDITQSSTDLLRLRSQIAQGNVNYNGNAKVRLTLEDGSEYPVEGTLSFAGASVDESTGAITLRAVFPNANHLLLPGMYVTAKISQGVLPHAYLVPQTAVTHTPTGDAQVMVVDSEGKVALKKVKTAGTKDSNWIINEGLENGDKIIIKGNAKVKEGLAVKATAMSLDSNATVPASSQADKPAEQTESESKEKENTSVTTQNNTNHSDKNTDDQKTQSQTTSKQ